MLLGALPPAWAFRGRGGHHRALSGVSDSGAMDGVSATFMIVSGVVCVAAALGVLFLYRWRSSTREEGTAIKGGRALWPATDPCEGPPDA